MELTVRRPGRVAAAVMLASGALVIATSLAVPGTSIGKSVPPANAGSVNTSHQVF
jgi:hypothetical protein